MISVALGFLPRSTPAADADASPTPKAHSAKKASPSPSPAKKSHKSSDASASEKKSATSKPSPSPSPKKSPSDTPKKADAPKDTPKKSEKTEKSDTSDDKPAKKKSKAKPKPATQKRQRSKQGNSDSKNAEPAPKRHSEPEPEKKPEPKAERSEKPEAPQKPAQRPPATAALPTPFPNSPESPKTGLTATRNTPPILPDNVVITKSGVQEEEPAEEPEQEPAPKTRWWWPFGGSTQHYRYLSRSVREAIDDAHVARHRWRYIVVHNSGTRQGSAKAFDYYHKHVRKMPNGLAYHFVIGNGTSTPNGSIEIGPRWINQLNGGHVHSDYLNSIALGVCLVGDYNKDTPTREQLEALDELVRYLRKRVGKTDHHLAVVKPHRDINPPQWPTDCPGDRFPYRWLGDKFNDQ